MDYLLMYEEWQPMPKKLKLDEAKPDEAKPYNNFFRNPSEPDTRKPEAKLIIKCEKYENFEEMMARFMFMTFLKEFVLVVEKNTRKIVCCHEGRGHGKYSTTFNRYLLDTMFFDNFDKESLKLQPGND